MSSLLVTFVHINLSYEICCLNSITWKYKKVYKKKYKKHTNTYDLPILLSHTVKSSFSYAYTSNYRNVFICNYCHKELLSLTILFVASFLYLPLVISRIDLGLRVCLYRFQCTVVEVIADKSKFIKCSDVFVRHWLCLNCYIEHCF